MPTPVVVQVLYKNNTLPCSYPIVLYKYNSISIPYIKVLYKNNSSRSIAPSNHTVYYLGIWLMRMVLNTIQSNQSLSILYPRNNHIITLYNIIAKAIQSQQPLLTISPTPL